ncbi:MAG TPA: fluoride efflux transporter CrcB [Solirubrobacterales bacterium]|jgi:CrcB protein|nr:fluoride efflux transporter CrcB [Solirubrobacterales bacterium]
MSKRRFDRRELGAIYVGGVVGALARVGLSQALPHGVDAWPWATFIVNMVGAALLGWFVTRLGERLPPSTYRRPFLATGLCGALTTFSTLQLELFKMVDGGYLGLAVAYAAATIAGGFLCVHFGTVATRRARILR